MKRDAATAMKELVVDLQRASFEDNYLDWIDYLTSLTQVQMRLQSLSELHAYSQRMTTSRDRSMASDKYRDELALAL